MPEPSAVLVFKPLMERAMKLMGEAYREVEGSGEKRVARAVETGRQLRAWQEAVHTDDLPPGNAASLDDIAAEVASWWGKDTELYEAVEDASRFAGEFLASAEGVSSESKNR